MELATPRQDTNVSWPVTNPILDCTAGGDEASSVSSPFSLERQDATYVFFTSHRRGGGSSIGAAASSDGARSFASLGSVLSAAFPLSHPFVFEWEGAAYLLPAAPASGEVRLYRSRGAFPHGWEDLGAAVREPLEDAVVLQHGETWFLLGSRLSSSQEQAPSRRAGGVRRGSRRDLLVWHAPSPLGPWEPHARSPAARGWRGVASSGRVLEREGALVRLSPMPGGGLEAWEIRELSPTAFRQVLLPGVGEALARAWRRGRPAPAGEPAVARLAGAGARLPGDEASFFEPRAPASSLASRWWLLSLRPPPPVFWNGRQPHGPGHLDVARRRDGGWLALADGDASDGAGAGARSLEVCNSLLLCWAPVAAAAALVLRLAREGEPAGRRALPRKFQPRAEGLGVRLRRALGLVPSPPSRPAESAPLISARDGAAEARSGLRRAIRPREGGEAGSPLAEGSLRAGSCSPPPLPASRRPSERLGAGWPRPVPWRLLALVVAGCAASGAAAFAWPLVQPAAPSRVEGQGSAFTIVCMTYDARAEMLPRFLRHYSACPAVAEVVVVWNRGPPPAAELVAADVPVRVRVEARNSLNNRFRVDPALSTRAVLSLDDDLLFSCADVSRAFGEWRRRGGGTMVGFFPRLLEGVPPQFRGESHAVARGRYNAVLTGAAFLDADAAYPAYWADAVAPARDAVDAVFNGEDVLMNYVLANASAGRAPGAGSPPALFLRPERRVDISKLSGVGISHDFGKFLRAAAQYLASFTDTFGGVPLVTQAFDWGERGPPKFCTVPNLGCVYA